MRNEDTREVRLVERPFDFTLSLPGSKSIGLRQLAISALAQEPSVLENLHQSSDIDAMTTALGRLGVNIERADNRFNIDPTRFNSTSDVHLDLDMSGVSLRLLLAVSATRTGSTTFDGHASLRARPNQHLLEALEQLGCIVQSNGGRLPINVSGSATNNSVRLQTSVSSQYLTALLLASPNFPRGIHIELIDTLTSAPYVELTLNEMMRRGVSVQREGNKLDVKPQTYRGGNIDIEGDATAATYFAALATLHQSTVHLDNLNVNTTQGDIEFLSVCEQLGATVLKHDQGITITGPAQLNSLPEINMIDMPDAALTLMAMAPYLPDKIRITGLATLRHKECDRISCPALELRKAGIATEEGPDHITIVPGETQPAVFDTYDDHRMAMAFAIFATGAPGCSIRDPNCVNKTYANFWTDLARAYH